MRPIDAVAHVGGRCHCLEAVQKSGRHIQMSKVIVVEQESLLTAERRRVPPNVDQHVVHGPVGAAHEFRLSAPRTSVHAPNHSLARAGLGILDERRGETRRAEVGVEYLSVERSGEQSPVVAERLRDKNENVGEVSPFNAHLEMLS